MWRYCYRHICLTGNLYFCFSEQCSIQVSLDLKNLSYRYPKWMFSKMFYANVKIFVLYSTRFFQDFANDHDVPLWSGHFLSFRYFSRKMSDYIGFFLRLGAAWKDKYFNECLMCLVHLQEHDSFRAFRSQNLNLHLSLETRPTVKNPNNIPVCLFYASTLRFLDQIKVCWRFLDQIKVCLRDSLIK